MTCYDANDIRTSLEKDLIKAETLLKAWENVTYPTKKDGTPYAVMSKNINGATYAKCPWASREGEIDLTVYAHDDTNGYISDSIACYANADVLTDAQKSKPENLTLKCAGLKQLYKYDLEDIKTRVNDRIAYLTQYCAVLRGDMLRLGDAYSTYLAAINSARTELYAQLTRNGAFDTHAYYPIIDTADKATRYMP